MAKRKKAAKRHPKKTAKKSAKKKSNQIPLPILKKRLASLARVVARRS